MARLDGRRRELERLVKRVLPVQAGNLAVRHYREGFRQGGFIDGSLQPWTVTRRQQSGGTDAASQYGPLVSERNRLMVSVQREAGTGSVTVYSRLPYSAVHNYGGEVHPQVTPKMRKWAWAMYYKAMGGSPGGKAQGGAAGASGEAGKWKALALTKRERLTVRIPQRQFIGASQTLNRAIEAKIREEVAKLLAP